MHHGQRPHGLRGGVQVTASPKRGPRSLIPAPAVEVASLEYVLLGRPHSWARDNAIATGKRDKRGRAVVRFITDERTRVGKAAHEREARARLRDMFAEGCRSPSGMTGTDAHMVYATAFPIAFPGMVCAFCKRADPGPDADHEWSVTVEAYYPTRVMGDIDRVTTLVLDALEGLVYVSDRQVASIRGERFVDRDNPRTVVRVARMGSKVKPRAAAEEAV